MNYFYVGDPVEFTSTKNNVTYKGVVTKTGSGRYGVCCGEQNFKVPVAMLRPTKLKDEVKKELVTAGTEFMTAKTTNKNTQDSRQASFCRSLIETYEFKRGQTVKYMCPNASWPEVEIVEVLKDEGKVVITNWKADLRSKLDYFGIGRYDQGRIARAKNTVTVWANRLKPSDGTRSGIGW